MEMENVTTNFKKAKRELTNEELDRKKSRKRDKKREQRERRLAVEVAIGVIDSMMQRQNSCSDPSVRYALLANTLMLIFDVTASASIVLTNDLDDKFKIKIRQSVLGLQQQLTDMMQWITDKGRETTTEVEYPRPSSPMTESFNNI